METTEQTKLSHLDGTIAMARNTPASATCSFFICINDQPSLNYGGKRNPDGQGFAAFGKVTSGMDVISYAGTCNNIHMRPIAYNRIV